MVGYLLDTCTISHWFNRHPRVDAKLDELQPALFYVSAISLGEFASGHASASATDVQKQVAFLKWLKETFDSRQLIVDRHCAENYGRFRATLFDKFGKQGQRPEQCVDTKGHSLGIDENDLWLVSQAYTHCLKFVTTDAMCRINEVCGDEVDIILVPLN